MRLLTTKLAVPPARAEWLPRPHLVQRLSRALQARLILISAPPGFGKTTLLSLCVAGMRHDKEAPTRRLAWLSLDQEDDEPARFWSYVVAAIRTACPGAGAALVEALQSPAERGLQPGVSMDALAELVNDLAAVSQPLTFVLDDFHTISRPDIHAGVRFVIDNLPPSVHIVIASRTDPPWPLALWRTRGHVFEIRADDLRLTPAEAADFLNRVMGLNLSADDIAALEERTEGWIAGLQMAALSMRGREDAASFIHAFGGSNRLVLDYLVEEALERQPTDVQVFLLRTSILERLCAPLCDAVLGGDAHQDSEGMLALLDRSNLFVTALDDERRWYRYHRLFADLLQNRLSRLHSADVALLHRRAGDWLAANGFISEAISHALAEPDYEHAADLIEQNAVAVAWRGEIPLLRRWISGVPDEVIRTRPILCLGNAAMQRTPDAVEQWLQAAESVIQRPLAASLPGLSAADMQAMLADEIAAIRLDLARWRGEPPEKLIEAAQRALARIPANQPAHSAHLHQQMAFDYIRLGNEDLAEQEFIAAAQLAAGNNLALAIGAVYDRSRIHMDQGRLHKTAEIYRQAMDAIVRPAEAAGRRVPAAGAIYIGLARVLLEWNDLSAADDSLARGLDLIAATQGQSIFVSGCVALSRLRTAQGRYGEAQAALDKALDVCTWDPALIHAMRAHALVVESETNRGALDTAIRWADGQDLAAITVPTPTMHGLARVRIAQHRAGGRNDLAPIVALLNAGLQQAESADHLAWVVDLLALKALALQVAGEEQAALSALRQAIERGEPERYTRTIIQHGAPMLAMLRRLAAQAGSAQHAAQRLITEYLRATGPHPPIPRAGSAAGDPLLVEPLSERELEVLRLLAGPLSSTEIAAQLIVSTNTVRTHIKSIYAKLGVHGRAAAVARARLLSLL